jgi:hypothetical protein
MGADHDPWPVALENGLRSVIFWSLWLFVGTPIML